MKIMKLEDFVVSAGAAAFIVCGSFASFPHQTDFEPKYKSHFEIPHNQDLPGHSFIYEHPSTIAMVVLGATVPFWKENSGSFPVFKLEW